MTVSDFLYPRTASLHRPNDQLSVAGGVGQGLPSQLGGTGTHWAPSAIVTTDPNAAGERLIQANIPCSIQGTAGKATGLGEVPSDAPGPSRWRFFIPLTECPKGTIKTEDILIDDEGIRYQVSAPYWNSLGWRVEAIMLEN